MITKCDRVEGLLPAAPRYDDESEDSEDEGWPRDGRVKYRPPLHSKDVLSSDPPRVAA